MTFLAAARLERRRSIGVAVEALGGLAMLAGLAMLRLNHDTVFAIFMFGGMGLVILGFLYGLLGVRCPARGSSLTWHAYSQLPYGEWSTWLDTLERCPRCGFEPGNAPVANDAA